MPLQRRRLLQTNSGDPLYPDRVECDVVDDTLVELASNMKGSENPTMTPTPHEGVDTKVSAGPAGVLSDIRISPIAAHAAELEAALNAMVDVVIVFDAMQRVKWINTAGRSLLHVEGRATRYTAADILTRMRLSDMNAHQVDPEHWPLA